jgi:hypothetical protein
VVTGLERNTRADIEADNVKPWQWVLLIMAALLGFLVAGALVGFNPNSVAPVRTLTSKVVQVPIAGANGNATAAFVLAIPVLYLTLLQALRVKLSDGFAEGAGLFAAGLAIGAVCEPLGNSLLTGAIVGLAIGAVGITSDLLGRTKAGDPTGESECQPKR